MSAAGGDRVLTVPNAISLARLLAVPVLVWLIVSGREVAALALLVASGLSDLVDGALARALGQVSRLGTLLDPVADRVTLVAVVVALAWTGSLLWPFVAVLALRDAVLAANLAVLRRRGVAPLPVHSLGKTATFVLFWGFALVLLVDLLDVVLGGLLVRVPGAEPVVTQVPAVATAVLVWGAGLYLWAGAGYVLQARRVLRDTATGTATDVSTTGEDGTRTAAATGGAA